MLPTSRDAAHMDGMTRGGTEKKLYAENQPAEFTRGVLIGDAGSV